MAKHTITNTSGGTRGFHAEDGEVTLDKGQSWTGEISDAEFKSAKSTGYFGFGAADDGNDGDDHPVSLSGKNKAELLAIAEAEGVEVEEGATNDDIRAAIELKRES